MTVSDNIWRFLYLMNVEACNTLKSTTVMQKLNARNITEILFSVRLEVCAYFDVSGIQNSCQFLFGNLPLVTCLALDPISVFDRWVCALPVKLCTAFSFLSLRRKCYESSQCLTVSEDFAWNGVHMLEIAEVQWVLLGGLGSQGFWLCNFDVHNITALTRQLATRSPPTLSTQVFAVRVW